MQTIMIALRRPILSLIGPLNRLPIGCTKWAELAAKYSIQTVKFYIKINAIDGSCFMNDLTLHSHDVCSAVTWTLSSGFKCLLIPISDGITIDGNAANSPIFKTSTPFAHAPKNWRIELQIDMINCSWIIMLILKLCIITCGKTRRKVLTFSPFWLLASISWTLFGGVVVIMIINWIWNWFLEGKIRFFFIQMHIGRTKDAKRWWISMKKSFISSFTTLIRKSLRMIRYRVSNWT